AARRQLRQSGQPPARELPQLLPPARPLAVQRPAPGARRMSGADDRMLAEVLAGLAGSPKSLPSKYFYDAEGSRLFEAITRQPEYYPTRVELALLEDRGAAIAAAVGPRAHVVEYGSGSGRKTRVLLDALEDPVAYTP